MISGDSLFLFYQIYTTLKQKKDKSLILKHMLLFIQSMQVAFMSFNDLLLLVMSFNSELVKKSFCPKLYAT